MLDFDAEDPMATRAPQTQADPGGLSMIGVAVRSFLHQGNNKQHDDMIQLIQHVEPKFEFLPNVKILPILPLCMQVMEALAVVADLVPMAVVAPKP